MLFSIEIADGMRKGIYDARLSKDGLQLAGKKNGAVINIAVGSPACHAGKASIGVTYEAESLTLRVLGVRLDNEGLAVAIADYLSGKQKDLPDVHDFQVSTLLFVMSCLPGLIPVITLGGAIPAVVGFGLVGLCLGISKNRKTPLAARMIAVLLISTISIGAVIYLIMLARR